MSYNFSFDIKKQIDNTNQEERKGGNTNQEERKGGNTDIEMKEKMWKQKEEELIKANEELLEKM